MGNRGKFFDHEELLERDLVLIVYDDPATNIYKVTDETAFHDGQHGTPDKVILVIAGIPVRKIESEKAKRTR